MNITGLVHVNINCSDFDRSLRFYELLGFQKVIDVPPKNTLEVAAAVGMPPYTVKGALLILQNSKTPLMIDLLEWQEPTDNRPPYPNLYHLGIARVALSTNDLDSDVAFLKSEGVEFLSNPATVKIENQPETRFVCFKDPDGTILELVE
ncbi:MAG: VOC family protein [SAR86 cluster bacterium]|jgi:catechol 2,3-dioxygenase-like lactoylglutathione lyase family enzyme|nr:VOC family protein [SAR86 cluster bacterium]